MSRFTDEQVGAELGHHSHDDESRFFRKDVGLLARDLAEAVMRSLTCGFNDATEQFYIYSNGVWQPNRSRIESEVATLLGNRYRKIHAANALDLIRFSDAPRISCDPLPRYINVRNGMVDWATGTLTDHDPGYLSTVQLPIEYDADASKTQQTGWPASC